MTDSGTIHDLQAMLKKHGLAELEFQDGERHLRIRAGGVGSEIARESSRRLTPERGTEVIPAPHAGVFRTQGPSVATTLPRLVSRGEIAGILQIGSLLRPVTIPEDGILERALVSDGSTVGYGTPLFAFRRHVP